MGDSTKLNEASQASAEATTTPPTLWTAATNGDIVTLLALLEDCETEIDATNNGGLTPLICAALAGQVEAVKVLLQHGARVDFATTTEDPEHGGRYAGVVTLLLDSSNAQADLKIEDQGFTALDAAAQTGHLEVVKMLLDEKESSVLFDYKPLFVASQKGHLEIVKLLLQRGAKADLLNHGFTSLNVAAKNGHLDVVQLLLDNGASVDLSPLGFSSLFFACCNGHLEVVRCLLDRGADIELATNAEKNFPLIAACMNSHTEVVKLLLNRGASACSAEIHGRTPLYFAAGDGNCEVIKMLLVNGALIDVVEEEGDTPLTNAAVVGRLSATELLLDNGANINHADKNGMTPLMHASLEGHFEVVKLLLEKGANVDLVDNDYRNTALMKASSEGYLEIVKLLLENGARTDLLDDCNAGALNYAVFGGNLDIVKLFMERGSRIYTQVDEDRCPFTLATRDKHFEIAKYLAETGAWRLSSYKDVLMASLEADKHDICKLIILACPQAITEDSLVLHSIAKSTHPDSLNTMMLLIEKITPGADYINYSTSECMTALKLAVINKQVDKVWQLVLHGANTTDTVNPFNDKDTPLTVWQLCEGDKSLYKALLHFWTPQTHKIHPRWVRDAVVSVMLVAKRLRWPFDSLLLRKILSHVAYGWYHAPHEEETKPKRNGHHATESKTSESASKRRKITGE